MGEMDNSVYTLTPAEKRFKRWLNVWGIVIGLALVGLILTPIAGLKSTAYLGNPIFFALTVGGLGGLLYAVQALRDGVRENAYVLDIILLTHLVVGTAMVVLASREQDSLTRLIFGLGRVANYGGGLVTLIFALPVYEYRFGKGFVARAPLSPSSSQQMTLHETERRLGRWAYFVAGAALVGGILIVLLQSSTSERWSRIGNPVFVAGSFGVVVMVVGAGILVRWRPEWRLMMGDMLVSVQVLSTLVLFVALVFDWTGHYAESAAWIMLIFTVVTVGMRLLAERSIYSGLYIPFWLFRELEAFADVVIEGAVPVDQAADDLQEVASVGAVAMNVDRYLAQVNSPRRLSAMISLLFVTWLRPTLGGHLSMSRMGYLERRQFIDHVFKRGRGIYRRMIQIKQLMVLGYYSDPQTYPQIGFEPFPERQRYQNLIKNKIPVEPIAAPQKALTVVREREHHCKICVIGSGAGGAVAAAKLAAAFAGAVTILEAGPYLRSHEFTHSEPDMIAALYKDGGMQISLDLNMAILQGACVGGSTVHNNGICFDLPAAVIQNWKNMGAEIDSAKLSTATQQIRKRLKVSKLQTDIVGPGSFKFEDGAKKLKESGADKGRIKGGPDWFELNLHGCLGCGYCNTGCRYGKKMSMLDTYVPDAEADGAQVIANCRAIKFDIEDDRVVGLRCKLDNQHDFYVHADYFVVACGTIASSMLLRESGVKGPVGEGISFNVGTSVSAEFPEPVRAYDGVQMCGYLEAEGYMLETLFNPPALFAMTMPGWFMDHFQNMRRYNYFANSGVMAPSAAIGKLRKPLPVVEDLIGRFLPSIDYSLAADTSTFKALKDGIKLLTEIYLAAGATRVVPSTYADVVFYAGDDGEKISQVIDKAIERPDDLYYASAHPQGGNAINRDPQKGVIDETFRVHGLQNIYVCDASVFPTSVQVNPQLSIMAMADYAAEMMVSRLQQ